MTFNEWEYNNARSNYLGYCRDCQDWTRDCTEPDVTEEYEYDCPQCDGTKVIGADTYLIWAD